MSVMSFFLLNIAILKSSTGNAPVLGRDGCVSPPVSDWFVLASPFAAPPSVSACCFC